MRASSSAHALCCGAPVASFAIDVRARPRRHTLTLQVLPSHGMHCQSVALADRDLALPTPRPFAYTSLPSPPASTQSL